MWKIKESAMQNTLRNRNSAGCFDVFRESLWKTQLAVMATVLVSAL